MSNVLTLKLNAAQRAHLHAVFKDSTAPKTPPYAEYQLRLKNCIITSYTSGKVVFQGSDAEVYASSFSTPNTEVNTQTPSFPQGGSDEVGTGDYFGPVCVCATIVTETSLNALKDLALRDSKALTDDMIRRLAPKIKQILPYSLLIVSPQKYNEVHARYNMNAIKALLHNKAYVNLSTRQKLPSFCVVDQFAPEKTYYRYLANEPEVQKGLHFETKAEDKYPAVGAASILAREAFLTTMDKMEETYGMSFQKGAGEAVDACARTFVEKYGMKKLGEVAKLHFKNTERI